MFGSYAESEGEKGEGVGIRIWKGLMSSTAVVGLAVCGSVHDARFNNKWGVSVGKTKGVGNGAFRK